MSEAATLFSALRQAADPEVVSAIEALVRDAPDRRLSRINALDLGVVKRNLNASLAIPVAVPVPLAAASVAMTTLREEREVKDLLT